MSAFDKKELSGSKELAFSLHFQVRFNDVDAAGIVYFARVLSVVHEAYEGFLESCGEPLAQVLSQGRWAAPILHAEADYFRPLRLGDEVAVELVAARRAGSRLILGWRLSSETKLQPAPSRVVHAVVQMVHAFVAPGQGSSAPVPETILGALRHLLDLSAPASTGT